MHDEFIFKKRIKGYLKVNVTVIEVGEKNDVNLRQICERFEISKNQMSNLIIEDDKNLTTVVTYANIKWQTVKVRKTESPKNDFVIFNWFCSIKTRKIPFK